MAYEDKPCLTRDAHARAVNAIASRQVRRAIEHLLGICSGLTADAKITPEEVLFLRTWFNDHEELTNEWPVNVIARRLNIILADGVITAEECDDLLQTLREIIRSDFPSTGSPVPEGPILPTEPNPSIVFPAMTFCLTGRFMWGTRAACLRAITGLGGDVTDNITQRLHYLVIGSMIEPQWAHTSFGRKIQKAMTYRDQGHKIAIVSERDWTVALEGFGTQPA